MEKSLDPRNWERLEALFHKDRPPRSVLRRGSSSGLPQSEKPHQLCGRPHESLWSTLWPAPAPVLAGKAAEFLMVKVLSGPRKQPPRRSTLVPVKVESLLVDRGKILHPEDVGQFILAVGVSSFNITTIFTFSNIFSHSNRSSHHPVLGVSFGGFAPAKAL